MEKFIVKYLSNKNDYFKIGTVEVQAQSWEEAIDKVFIMAYRPDDAYPELLKTNKEDVRFCVLNSKKEVWRK